jgi:polyhydroxyalkanoate synthesis regulator protein
MSLSIETKEHTKNLKLYNRLYDKLKEFYGDGVDTIISDYFEKKIRDYNDQNPLFKKNTIDKQQEWKQKNETKWLEELLDKYYQDRQIK